MAMFPIYPDAEPITIAPEPDGKIHIQIDIPAFGIFPTIDPIAASMPFLYHGRVYQLFFTTIFFDQYFWTQDIFGYGGEQWIFHYPGNPHPTRLYKPDLSGYYNNYFQADFACSIPSDAHWSFYERFVDLVADDLAISITPHDYKTLLGSGTNMNTFENPRIEGKPMAADLWYPPGYSNFFEELRASVQTIWLAGWNVGSCKSCSIIPSITLLLMVSFFLGGVVPPPRTKKKI